MSCLSSVIVLCPFKAEEQTKFAKKCLFGFTSTVVRQNFIFICGWKKFVELSRCLCRVRWGFVNVTIRHQLFCHNLSSCLMSLDWCFANLAGRWFYILWPNWLQRTAREFLGFYWWQH